MKTHRTSPMLLLTALAAFGCQSESSPDAVTEGGADAAVGADAQGGFFRRTCSAEGQPALRLHVSEVDVRCDDDADAPRLVLDLFRTGASLFPIEPGTVWTLGRDVEFTGGLSPGGGPSSPVTGGSLTLDAVDVEAAEGAQAASGEYALQLQDGTILHDRFSLTLCPAELATCPAEQGSACVDCDDCDCPDGRHLAGPGTCTEPVAPDFCDCARLCAEPPALACPASAALLDIGARPYVAADGTYRGLPSRTVRVSAAVVSSAAGALSLAPEGADWRVDLRFPADAAAGTAGLAQGTSVSLDLGIDTPFWEEAAFVVRRADGSVALAAISGALRWLDEPMFQAADLTVTLGAECPVRPDECLDQIDREVLVAGGAETLRLLGGQSGDVTLGGAPLHARLGMAARGTGEVRCTDQADSWVSLLISPGGHSGP